MEDTTLREQVLQNEPTSEEPAWKEELPDGCPGKRGYVCPDLDVIRLSKTKDVTPANFLSHAARGLPIGDNDPCEFAACSLYLERPIDDFGEAIRRLPNFRKFFKFAISLSINDRSGRMELDPGTNHVNLWMYKTFDPMTAITNVRAYNG